MVGQRRSFGRAGGAAGELDVDRVVELQLAGEVGERGAVAVAAHAEHIVKTQKAAGVALADANERGQRRQPLCLQPAGSGALDLRRELAQHADIAAGLERIGRDQGFAADLVERVFELGQAIRGVDVDEDETGLRRRELRDCPFGVVRRPDADPIARSEPERQQPGGERVGFGSQLAIAPADVLLAHDQRVAGTPALRRLIEMHADGLADQWRHRDAVGIALRQLDHFSSRRHCVGVQGRVF